MDNSSFFVGPIQTVHFLSVVTYMNTLSDIFYSLDLIKTEERLQSFPIINALLDYLDDSGNESEKRRDLTRELLQNSHLYGGKEDETLDMEYINATFEYIISNVIFSRYGNVHGYLAKTLSREENLTFSSLRNYILQDLMQLEYMNEDGSFSYLSFRAIVVILETVILPLFPKPEKDMRLIDVDYIYEQAGWMLARSIKMNSTNFTPEEFISLSQAVESTASRNESYQSALKIFTLPTLLFYAHQKNGSFRKQSVAHLMKKQDFWLEAFLDLFSHLRETFEMMSRKELENSPVYQFALSIKKFKNRTSIAREMLKNHCPGIRKSELESEIRSYKLCSSCSYCSGDAVYGLPLFGKLFPSYKLLPNIDKIYSAQLDEIRRKYQSHAKVLIREAIREANLTNIINSSDTTVFHDQILPETKPYGYGSILNEPVLEPNFHLFTVDNSDSRSLLVLIDNQSNITLVRYRNRENFMRKFGLSVENTKIQESTWKSSNESLDDFENKIAKRLAKDFRKALYALGYDKTIGEKVLDFGLMLVPFYDCIRNVRDGSSAEAAPACMGDIAMLIPFGAQLASMGSKLGTLAGRSLVAATGASVRTLTMRIAIRLAIQAGPRQLLAEAATLVQKEILTKQMFKSLSLGLIRTVDPGFELIGLLSRKGATLLVDIFERILLSAKKVPSMSLKSPSLKKVWTSLINRLKTMKDVELVPSPTHTRCKRSPTRPGGNSFVGVCYSREVFRTTYPERAHPSGPEYVAVPGGYAPLMKAVFYETKIPVLVSRVSSLGGKYYRACNIETGQSFGPELRPNRRGVLEPVEASNIAMETIRKELEIEKERNLDEAAEFISKSRLKVPKETAKEIMRHYILATEPVPAFDPHSSIFRLDRSLGVNIDARGLGVRGQYLPMNRDNPVPSGSGVYPHSGVGVPSDFNVEIPESERVLGSDIDVNDPEVRRRYLERYIDDPVPSGSGVYPPTKVAVPIDHDPPLDLDIEIPESERVLGSDIDVNDPEVRSRYLERYIDDPVPSGSGVYPPTKVAVPIDHDPPLDLDIEIPESERALVSDIDVDNPDVRRQYLGPFMDHPVPSAFGADPTTKFAVPTDHDPSTDFDIEIPESERYLGLGIDVDNPEVRRQYLGLNTDVQFPMGSRVKQYTGVGVPTYNDFAIDFVENGGLISGVYRNWRVENPQQLDDLLYHPDFYESTVGDRKKEIKKIGKLYGLKNNKMFRMEMLDACIEYDRNKAWLHMNFEDFFAILKYVKNGYVEAENDVIANRLLHIALYRLALRQGIGEIAKISRELLLRQSVSSVPLSFLEKLLLSREPVSFGRLQVISLAKRIHKKYLRKELLEGNILSYTIRLDSSYPIVNLNSIFKNENKGVILPNVKFQVQLVTKRKASAESKCTVLHYKMDNVPVDELTWRRDLVRELEALQRKRS